MVETFSSDSVKKDSFFKYLMVLCAVLALLIVSGAVYKSIFAKKISNFDLVSNVSLDRSNIEFSINPREGSGNAWVKNIPASSLGLKEDASIVGVIYDFTIKNNTGKTINDWYLQVPLNDGTFMNKAWCGTVDIYQNQNNQSTKNHQQLDLRNVDEKQIQLNYFKDELEFLFPMSNGDYIKYFPGQKESESPIYDGGYKTMGLIIYHFGNEVSYLDLDGWQLGYKVDKLISQTAFFWILVALFVIWCMALVVTISSHIVIQFYNRKIRHDAQIIEQTMSTFANFIDAKDASTNGHSIRVAKYSKYIAKQLGLKREEYNKIYLIGLMHDCGKIGIPDNILTKPGRLTDEEFAIMKTHPEVGAKILCEYSAIEGIQDGVLFHHERYDGRGYPTGLAGEQIPLIARIICVADSFDAMNSNRCYRAKLSKEKIMSELVENKGKQFDPAIVDAIVELIEKGKIVITG